MVLERVSLIIDIKFSAEFGALNCCDRHDATIHVHHLFIFLFGLVWLVSFNDTWSQKGHSVSCMTILFISKCKSADRTSGRT